MRVVLGLLVGSLVVLAPAVGSAQAQFTDGSLRSATLSFDGKATMGDFTGTTTTTTGAMTGGSALSEVRGWVESPVNTLKTGNGRRDRDLNKSMESDKFPTMRFDLTGVAPGAIRGDTTAVTLSGTFTIHGVTREVTLPGTVIRSPDAVRLTSIFPMNLTDYQIGGLSKMLGLLKMHPDITVHVDLIFDQQPAGH